MTDSEEILTKIIAETTNFIFWSAEEPDGETTFHVELGTATLHFFREEWDEFLEAVKSI